MLYKRCTLAVDAAAIYQHSNPARVFLTSMTQFGQRLVVGVQLFPVLPLTQDEADAEKEQVPAQICDRGFDTVKFFSTLL